MEEKRAEKAHRNFAVLLHGQTWDLLDKVDRSVFESDLMLHAAHASLYHWLQVGSELNHQRGEWLIARVQTVIGRPELALYHAERTLELTESHSSLMEDFDFAFAYEGMARAHALAGNHGQAMHWLGRAQEAGEGIQDNDDKEVFFAELNGGEWHGLDPGWSRGFPASGRPA